ncbi:MAG: YgiT-type zinc finger protein [Anaerolineae bacterium]
MTNSINCSTCGAEMVRGGLATEVYRRDSIVVTVTGIPAVAVCPKCGNAIIEWDVAQQVEELVQPILKWPESHTLIPTVVTITFTAQEKAA